MACGIVRLTLSTARVRPNHLTKLTSSICPDSVTGAHLNGLIPYDPSPPPKARRVRRRWMIAIEPIAIPITPKEIPVVTVPSA